MKLEFNNIKAIIFDADGTLFGIKGSIGSVYSECCLQHGLKVDPEMLDSRVEKIWLQFRPAYRNEAENFVSSPERELKVWKEFCFALVEPYIGTNDFDPIFETIYNAFASPDYRTLKPGTLEVLQHVRQTNYVTGILSNNDERVRTLALAFELGDYLDHIFPSAEIGFKKPSLKCFESVTDRLKLKPEEILYVGDNYELDYLASISAGWKSIWVNHKDLARTDSSCFQIGSLLRLKTALTEGSLAETPQR